MITRIVKMHFEQDKVEDFKTMFDEIKDDIRKQTGCSLLELYQDAHDETVFFTYSYWNTENDLNNYRHSSLFKEIWPKTKAMFSQPASANTVNKIQILK
ncbi:putative quinol monooxygenase [Nonlabens ponticola]|uniref:Antibiotic biosynthesis monooxygenase n=1 Tax=Nonlabens ponticola TaxID=2496866 RepID=A0A3S9MYJ6_9FLAO|nr:antibiotic biosynthesis monooxygenase family protein [Nonlabens ponticola]AZQ44321.1 antibiotic biosynthesis monooxygenase [Nonlabens ponticola]